MFKSLFSTRVNPLPLSAPFSSSAVVVDPLRDGKFNSSSTPPPPQMDEQKKTAWCSIYLAALFTFMASIQYTLFITSLWPFMQILDPTVTVGFFGAVIAMYSLSQIVASHSLAFGQIESEYSDLPCLILCNVCMLIGNAMYFFVELFPAEWSRYVLSLSRLIAGIGLVQYSLLKSFAASASINDDRSTATAFVTGGSALGFTMGPAVQILFTWIDYPGTRVCIWPSAVCVNVSMFNAPALFACLLNILLMFSLIYWFRESSVGILKKKLEDDDSGSEQQLPPYDRLAIGICYLLRFTQLFVFTNIETIGTAFAMMMFMWSPKEVVFWESIAHSLKGLMALVVYAAYIVFNLGKRIDDRLACLCSLAALLLFHLLTFSWPFLPDNVQQYDEEVIANITMGGCNHRQFAWCSDLRQINVWVYYVLMFICVGIALPSIIVTMNTLFSRIIGPRMQSKQQGTMEMFGGCGRLLGPLLMGYLYRIYGPKAIWILEMAVIGLMLCLWLIFYKRLVPLRIPEKLNENGDEQRGEQHSSREGKGDIYSINTANYASFAFPKMMATIDQLKFRRL